MRCCWRRSCICSSPRPICSSRSISTGCSEHHDKSVCQDGRVRPRGLRDQGRQGQGLHRQRQRHDLRRPCRRGHRRAFSTTPRSSASACRSRPATPMSARPTRSTSSAASKTKELFRKVFSAGQGQELELHPLRTCSSTSSPATRPITARPGACRRATSSAGRSPATCCGEGYAKTFKELMETTDWDSYGTGTLREMRELHGALRLRADRRRGDDLAARGRRSRSPCSVRAREGPMAPEIPLDQQRPGAIRVLPPCRGRTRGHPSSREATGHSAGGGGVAIRPSLHHIPNAHARALALLRLR